MVVVVVVVALEVVAVVVAALAAAALEVAALVAVVTRVAVVNSVWHPNALLKSKQLSHCISCIYMCPMNVVEACCQHHMPHCTDSRD